MLDIYLGNEIFLHIESIVRCCTKKWHLSCRKPTVWINELGVIGRRQTDENIHQSKNLFGKPRTNVVQLVPFDLFTTGRDWEANEGCKAFMIVMECRRFFRNVPYLLLTCNSIGWTNWHHNRSNGQVSYGKTHDEHVRHLEKKDE